MAIEISPSSISRICSGLLAEPPHQRMQGVEIAPERRRDVGEAGVVDRLLQYRRVRCQLDQRLLEKCRAEEIGRLGIGEAAGMRRCPGQQVGYAARRLGNMGGIVHEHHLRHAPGRLKPVDGHGEIDRRRRLAGDIDERIVRQFFGPRPVKQPVRLHRRKILAVDPDEIDRAARVATRRLFGDDARHRLGGIAELHMLHGDAIALRHQLADPGDIGVDLLVARPGIPVDRLPLGVRDDRRPVAALRRSGCHRRQCQHRCQQPSPESLHRPSPHHMRRRPVTRIPAGRHRPARAARSARYRRASRAVSRRWYADRDIRQHGPRHGRRAPAR